MRRCIYGQRFIASDECDWLNIFDLTPTPSIDAGKPNTFSPGPPVTLSKTCMRRQSPLPYIFIVLPNGVVLRWRDYQGSPLTYNVQKRELNDL
jgi:hypothetical protein